jgi:hypothetical protein
MAKVFTPKEVFDESLVPSIESYKEFKKWARAELEKMHEQGLIIGSMFYGSMIQGDFYAGSDLDLLIIYNSDKLNRISARKVFGELERKGKELFNIGLSPHPRISDCADDWRAGELSGNDEEEISQNQVPNPEKPSCSTGHRFVAYLKTCASTPQMIEQNVVGKNPIDLLTGPLSKIIRYRQEASPAMRLHEMMARMVYVQNRLKEKTAAPSSDDGINYELLALRVREPVFSALDLLWYKNGYVPTTSDGRLIKKADLAELFCKEFEDFDSRELKESIKLFLGYREVINKLSRMTLQERAAHKQEYSQMIKFMNEKSSAADSFILRCFDYVKNQHEKELVASA